MFLLLLFLFKFLLKRQVWFSAKQRIAFSKARTIRPFVHRDEMVLTNGYSLQTVRQPQIRGDIDIIFFLLSPPQPTMFALVGYIVFTLSVRTSVRNWFLYVKICWGYSLEATLGGAFNESPKHVFCGEIRKNINIFFVRKKTPYLALMINTQPGKNVPYDIWKHPTPICAVIIGYCRMHRRTEKAVVRLHGSYDSWAR